eukprot:3230189-Ditylum_brightwellii.AAC.2
MEAKLLLWVPPTAAADAVLEELIKSCYKREDMCHIFLCPWIFTQAWQTQLYNTTNVVFQVPVSIPFWDSNQHEPLVVAVCLPFLRSKPWGMKGRHSWWNWKEICVECGTKRVGVQGLFCANFGSSQRGCK